MKLLVLNGLGTGILITALLAGESSIREVIAFPKSGGGVDPLTDAPAPITAAQRKESGIDAKPKPKGEPVQGSAKPAS